MHRRLTTIRETCSWLCLEIVTKYLRNTGLHAWLTSLFLFLFYDKLILSAEDQLNQTKLGPPSPVHCPRCCCFSTVDRSLFPSKVQLRAKQLKFGGRGRVVCVYRGFQGTPWYLAPGPVWSNGHQQKNCSFTLHHHLPFFSRPILLSATFPSK